MTDLVVRIVFPFSIVIGLALWTRGYATIGDGFSAGAVAGLGAVLLYMALEHPEARRRTAASQAPRFLAGGLLLALAVVLAPLAWGQPPVTHIPGPETEPVKIGVLELHTATLFDLGVAFAVYGAVVGTFDRLLSREPRRPEEEEEP